MQLKRPLLKKVQESNYVLFAEPEVRLMDVDIYGSAFVGLYSYMVSGYIRSYVEIGRYCSIGRNVSIGLGEHNYKLLSTSPFYSTNCSIIDIESVKLAKNNPKRRIIIGNDVWIGDGAYICNGVTIGDGAVIGCNAVVTKSVPAYTIVAGVPSKVIKKRFDEKIEKKIIESKWFEKSPERLLECFKKTSLIDQIECASNVKEILPVKYYKLTNLQ